MEKRFDDKGISNNNLRESEWNFYKEVAYPMIEQKKAALFVIYHEDIPISVTLNFLADEILFDAITVFDIDYYKFHLGSVNVRKLIEWCLDNKIKILDFSKGHFDYKLRWANKTYHFDYHLIYNPRSVPARLLALVFKWYFQTKNYLREKKINETYHKLTYRLARKSTSRKPAQLRIQKFGRALQK